MQSCKQVCENATELKNEETTFLRRLTLRFHLLMCKHCRRFVRQLDATMSATRELDEPEAPSEEEINRVLERLGKQ